LLLSLNYRIWWEWEKQNFQLQRETLHESGQPNNTCQQCTQEVRISVGQYNRKRSQNIKHNMNGSYRMQDNNSN